MRLLLDTHSFLWFINGSAQLTGRARTLIEDLNNENFVSAASLWEIAIKVSIGKLGLAEPFAAFIPHQLQVNAMSLLPIKLEHLAKLVELPRHHGDPFDRLLATQALFELMVLVSSDAKLDPYGVQREW